MLKNLFTRFDNHCLKNNIYKLYTIGDCYVALGVIDANNREVAKEARAIVEFAFDLIDIIEEVRSIIKCETLNMRIGIHTVY